MLCYLKVLFENHALEGAMKRYPLLLSCSFSLVLFFLLVPVSTLAQSPTLQQGIDLYQDEQFSESIPVLQKARGEEPNSSTAAFFLGMAHKQTGNYEEAIENLRAAVTLTPKIKEALVELVEVLFRRPTTENIEEAMKWIVVAEEEKIAPAKIAFLKGLILQHQGNNEAAIAAFEKAKETAPELGQTVDLQVAIALLKDQKLEQAKVRLQTAIQQSPQTDLAAFARQYLDVVEKRIELEKPLRVTLSLFEQYDTNVISNPMDGQYSDPSITDTTSAVTATSLRVNYLPKLNGPWLLNAQYAFYANFHDEFATSQDLISNSLYLAPGYSVGDSSFNLKLDYNSVLLRNPSHKQYLDTFTIGPFVRHLYAKAHLFEAFAGYGISEYTHNSPLNIPQDPDEDRDSAGLKGSLSWIWLFKPSAFMNLRYDYDRAKADGPNWDKDGHNFSLNLSYPLREKLSLQVSGQMYLEDYTNNSSFSVAPYENKKREDKKYVGSLGLTWEIMENASLIGQYTATRQNSNIAVYDYRRELYTAGIEYRF